MRPPSSDIEKEDFSKLLPEAMMRDEEEEEMAGTSFLAGTRSFQSLNAVTRKERKIVEQVQGEIHAGTSMTS